MTKAERLEQALNTLVVYDINEPRKKLKDFIDSMPIERFLVGRRCTGTKYYLDKKGKQKSRPKYKLTRWVICFVGGTRYNVDKLVFSYYKKGKHIEYFNFYE